MPARSSRSSRRRSSHRRPQGLLERVRHGPAPRRPPSRCCGPVGSDGDVTVVESPGVRAAPGAPVVARPGRGRRGRALGASSRRDGPHRVRRRPRSRKGLHGRLDLGAGRGRLRRHHRRHLRQAEARSDPASVAGQGSGTRARGGRRRRAPRGRRSGASRGPVRVRTRARELALQFLYPSTSRAGTTGSASTLPEGRARGKPGEAEASRVARRLVDGVTSTPRRLRRDPRGGGQNWDIGRMRSSTRNALRIGCYEMPPRARGAHGGGDQRGDRSASAQHGAERAFINGILDASARNAG